MTLTPAAPVGAPWGPPRFDCRDVEGIVAFFAEYGFVLVAGILDETRLRELDAETASLQRRLLAGELPVECGTVVLDSPDATVDGEPFAHYVCCATEVSTPCREAVHAAALVALVHAVLGSDAWLLDDDRFGVVYQDARPGAGSAYSRIGWHSDEQSGPHLDVWPSVAFTLHLDATSPANGFLRVKPGSHRGDATGMPLGFERVPGEVAVYAERGDVILHHSALWHSAARATDDETAGIRRHLRGGWYAGARLEPNHGVDDFVKNARR